MFGNILRLAILVGIGFAGYNYYKADLHNRPEMPEGAFSISYKNGMRAILVDVPNERDTRRYFGYPAADLPFYIEDAWSFCYPPKKVESEAILNQLGNKPGERLEAICIVDVEGQKIERGLVTSVPQL